MESSTEHSSLGHAAPRGCSRLLVVGDTENVRVLCDALRREPALELIESSESSDDFTQASQADLVILVSANPRNVCSALKAHASTINIPVLVVTLAQDVQERVEALNSGADACLCWPVDSGELIACVGALRRSVSSSRLRSQGLALENQTLKTIIDSMPVGVLTADAASRRITFANATAQQLLKPGIVGAVVGEHLPETPSDDHGDPIPLDRMPLHRALCGEETRQFESYFSARDTAIVGGAAPVRDHSGNIVAVVSSFADITEIKQAQRRVTDILESITDAFVALDSQLRFTYVNREAVRLLHHTREEMIGVNMCDLFPGSERFREQYERVLADRITVHFEDYYAPLDFWVEVHAYPSSDGLAVYFREVSERKRLEQELAKARETNERSLAQLQAVIDSMAEGLCVVDQKGEFLLTNNRFREIIPPTGTLDQSSVSGYSQRVSVFDNVTNEYIPLEQWPVTQVLSGRTVRDCELRVRFSNNEERVVRHSGAPIRDANGTVTMAVMTIQDVTALKQAELDLDRSREHLDLAQKAAQIGSFDWDLHTGEIVWSEELQRIYGLQQGPYKRDNEQWRSMVVPDDIAAAEDALQTAILTDTEYRAEFRILRADTAEQRWIDARGRVFYDSEGNPQRIIGVNMDVTEHKQAEEALRSSEKLAAAGRMAGTLAHEINNPMAAVTNLIYLLAQHPGLDDVARSYIELADQELARIQHIVKNTLGFYRDSLAPVPVDLVEVIESVLQLYERRIRDKGIRVETRFEFEDSVYAFPGEMRQVFSNLVANAIEALPDGGTISIRSRSAVNPITGRYGVRITISDDGPGISREVLGRIFDPFFTTKGEKGTGLGLWVSKGIVQKHEGTIRVLSSTRSYRHGTSFTVFIPISSSVGKQRTASA